MIPRTLTGRIVLTTVAVAVIAVVAVSVVGFRLIRQESVAQTRLVLHSSAVSVAVAPTSERRTLAARIEHRTGGRVDVAFGGDGSVSGLGTPVTSALEARLASSTKVSARVRDGSRTLLVEAVAARGGGSVIAVEDVSLFRGDLIVWRFLVALGIGLLVAVGLGVALSRVTTRPLRGIVTTAGRLARGERGVVERAPVGRSPSLSEVAEVAEIRGALGALDDALARSEGRQREFLLSISHELRTPLTAIRGYADAMADGLVGADDTARIGGVLAAETQRLDAFVRDLLALARLEADDFPIERTSVDVGRVVAETAAAWAGTASRVGVRLGTVEPDRSVPGPAVVPTDPMRLRQVLDGLVENALRVAPTGSEVRLQAVVGADHVGVRVSDDGPGFAGSDLARVFERGYLRDRYRDERPVGTGLGLSIAGRLVRRLGGTVGVDGDGPGASFVVRLPRG